MRKLFLSGVCITCIFFAIGISLIAWKKEKQENADAEITIDVKSVGPELSQDMYGIFFEDINHAADGGLYAELIQNRDFEYNREPENMRWINDESIMNNNNWKERYKKPGDLFAWSMIKTGNTAATMVQADKMPLSEENPKSLELSVTKLDAGKAGIANDGYWGIGVQKGEGYHLSFYAHKNDQFKGNVLVSLESRNGKVYASKQIDRIGNDWKQFTADLVSPVHDSSARLVIYALSTGKVWFDMVSLFPANTFKNRQNGLRKDLAEMLVALRPSFLRFPGGCVAEGATLENRIQWKKTIGDLKNRPGNWNLWRYHTTDGLGYHEFLQFCEDLNIAPMYVVNVGMSCQAREGVCAPIGEINEYVQDALDAIEYAMGPVSSKWGAMRVANGHPAPFKIKYVEIGNENRGPFYQEVYKIFYTALKAKYPGIITIADEPITIANEDRQKYPGVQQEIVDEHYYKSPGFFYSKSNLYDSYSRKDPRKIYIGEFAVTSADGGLGNMKAALGEAAFMVGMERNADLVDLVSYAPTFVNTNDRRWNPDMIVYNSSKAFGTPSYYAYQLFSANRPDYILPASVTYNNNNTTADYSNLRGGINFAGRNSLYQFKDIKVIMDGKDVLNDDLSHGVDNWTIKNDNWETKDGILYNRFDEMKARIEIGNSSWKDYTFSFKTRKTKGAEGIHIGFLTDGDKCTLNLNDSIITLMQETTGNAKALGKLPHVLQSDKWYDISIEIKGQFLKCKIDGKQVFDVALKEKYNPAIYSTAGFKKNTGEVIIKIVNPHTTSKACSIKLSSKMQAVGSATVIQSGVQSDENTFNEPEKISPKTNSLDNVSQQFIYNCPANSIVVLRLKVAQ